MKADQKKAIETKWQRLLDQADKTRKPEPPAKPAGTTAGAKVIRRRKGRKDMPVS